jgi:hypothetical protein
MKMSESDQKQLGVKPFIKNIFKTDEERRRRGDDLGIYLYIFSWFFIILPSYFFSNNPIYKEANLRYLFFDFSCFIFIIIHYADKVLTKRNKEGELLESHRFVDLLSMLFDFPKIKDLLSMLLYVGLLYLLFRFTFDLLMNLFISSQIPLNASVENAILSLIRAVTTEELAFRGGYTIILYLTLSIITNHKSDSRKPRETYLFEKDTSERFLDPRKVLKLSVWEKKEIALNYITIVLVGIGFGLFHFPNYYFYETFPYFFIGSLRIHIALPIAYLCILGILLGITRYKYGLVASILLHFINNFFSNAVIISMILL